MTQRYQDQDKDFYWDGNSHYVDGTRIDPAVQPTWLSAKPVSLEVLLDHLPIGKAWHGFRIPGKIAYKFIKGLAGIHQAAWQFLNTVRDQIDYRSTTQMLQEWETAVSIPDPCLPRGKTQAERRKWIEFRLNKKRWNTEEDWHDLAAIFGLRVRITQGWKVQKPALYGANFPVGYFQFPKLGRFRVYIDVLDVNFGGYPYDGTVVAEDQYPIPYGTGPQDFDQFKCLIERVAPANVLIIWNEFPAIPPHGNSITYDREFDEEFS